MNQTHDKQVTAHPLYLSYLSSYSSPFNLSVTLVDENQQLSINPAQFLSFLFDCQKMSVKIMSISWKSSLWKRFLFFCSRSQYAAALSYRQVAHMLHLAGFKTQPLTWFQTIQYFFKSQHTITTVAHNAIQKDHSVSIIIPCKNEAGNIERAIQELSFFDNSVEILFVEGASRDNTWEEIERIQHKYPEKNIKRIKQQGKGKAAAVHNGFAAATGSILIILDGDLTTPPSEIYYCYEIIKHNPHAFINGTRMWLTMEKQATPFLNYFCNKGFAYILSMYTQTYLTDTLCGTKVLSKHNYERITQLPTYLESVDPFGDFTLILGAYDLGLPLIEVPFNYKARTYGTTQISRFKNGFDLLMVLSFYTFKRIQQLWRKK